MADQLITARQADDEKMTCSHCRHFRLHYIKYSRGYYSALIYGHCVKPRLKKRYADDKACTYWIEKPEI